MTRRSPRRASATTSGPSPGRLCDFCTFKPYCPAHGGDPVDAAELRGPGTMISARRSPSSPPADAARRTRRRPGTRPVRSPHGDAPLRHAGGRRVVSRVHAFDLRVDTMMERLPRPPAGPPVLRAVERGGSRSAVDLRRRGARRVRRRPGRRVAPRCRARGRIGPHQRPDQGVLPPGAPDRRPPARRPAPVWHAPTHLQLVPVGPRGLGVHRRRAPRRHARRTGAGSRSPPPSLPAGSTRGCTTPPT